MTQEKKHVPRTAREILKMKAFYDDGRSFAEVGAEFGLSSSRVEQIFRKNNVPTRRKTVSKTFLEAMRNRRTILEKAVLTKLYLEEKLTVRRIAESLQTGDHVVRSNLKAYGIPIRPLGKYTNSQLTPALLEHLYIDQKLTAQEIADRLGYSTMTIAKKLSKFGIKKRRSSRGGTTGTGKPAKLTVRESSAGQRAKRSADKAVAPDETSAELLTVAQIAEKYKIHPDNLRKLIRDGFFPRAFRQIIGKIRRWMVPVADLAGFAPRKRGRNRLANPTAATIHSRGVYARAEMRNSHGYGKAEINEMLDLEQQGWTRAEIADRFRLAERIVSDVLNQAGLRPPRAKKPPRPKKELKRFPKEVLVELYAENQFSTRDILEKLNTNFASLYINLRHYGIPLRDERQRLSAQEQTQILLHLLLEEKLSPEMIADRMELTAAYVKRKIKELKIGD